MYSVIQFDEKDGGTVALVHKKWLTPSRTEVYWPPLREEKAFQKLLAQDYGNTPDEKKWKLYGVQRVFIDTDVHYPSSSKKRNSELIVHHDSHTPQSVAFDRNDDMTEKPEDDVIKTTVSKGYEDKVVSLLAHIKIQNDVIISMLRDKGNNILQALKPEFKFPLKTFEDLETVEQLLTVQENHANLHVAVLDLDKSHGEAFATELNSKYGPNKAKFYKCDVTKDLDVVYDAVVKDFRGLDAVVNNAGIMNDGPNHYQKEIEVNVTALISSSLKAYNLMRTDHGGKGGTIINISSIAGLFQCFALPIYTATKSAVLQFSNCLGMDPHYSRSGVRVITMCFGCTDTSLLASNKYGAIDKETDDEDLIGQAIKTLPMQRPEAAVQGVLHAFKNGASASTWLVSANNQAEDISANVTKGYQVLSQGIFE